MGTQGMSTRDGVGRGAELRTVGSHHVAEVCAERPGGLVVFHHTAVVENLPTALTA